LDKVKEWANATDYSNLPEKKEPPRRLFSGKRKER
jgi:hypothetical protein